ncbi:MAG: VOC family protein [Chitinophagales bacterium]|nr:VOC family protein [Chitinophagaceae bacterium]MCB9065987.1 VOC family protein [Chitinophagales bacterium]
MSTAFQGLRTVVYMVDDLKAATDWYKDILGQEPYYDTEYYVGFNVGGYEFGLHPQKEPMEKAVNVYAYWGVEDAQKMYEHLLSKGATELEKPMDLGEGIVLATVKDPWGNALGVICNPHFKLP